MPSLKQLRFVVLLKLRVREHNRKIIINPPHTKNSSQHCTRAVLEILWHFWRKFQPACAWPSGERWTISYLREWAKQSHKERDYVKNSPSAKLHYSRCIVHGGGSAYFFTQKQSANDIKYGATMCRQASNTCVHRWWIHIRLARTMRSITF